MKWVSIVLMSLFSCGAHADVCEKNDYEEAREVVVKVLDALKKKKLEDLFPVYSSELQTACTITNLMFLLTKAEGPVGDPQANAARDLLKRYYDAAGAKQELSNLTGPSDNSMKFRISARHVADPCGFNAACRSFLKSDADLPDCVATIEDFKITINGGKAMAFAWAGLQVPLIKQDGFWKIDTELYLTGANQRVMK